MYGGAEPFFTELRTIYQAIRNIRIPWAPTLHAH
jgi:hypothetical protein